MPSIPILIVEDNRINAMILEAMLRKRGYTPVVAHDADSGAALAEAQRPGLVLMDLQMPRKDGFAAAADIRRRLGSHPVTFVAVTANATEANREACREAGFVHILAKPLDFNEVIDTVRRWAGEA